MELDAERARLAQDYEGWLQWGPYLSERAWGTVREDYSADGSAWEYLSHDAARFRAYRWNEDGLAGICDRTQALCFALALWNGRDPILKERLFGLTGNEGNHGEDVKEYYYYLDNLPSHAYMRMLYRYPHAAFPYDELVRVNRERTRQDPEFELLDTGVFAEQRYCDVTVEYAKVSPTDILIAVTIRNAGPETAPLTVLPTVWFRNHWSWGYGYARPALRGNPTVIPTIHAQHDDLGQYTLYCEAAQALMFTENETNTEALFKAPNASAYTKDAFHRRIVHGDQTAVNPELSGTKAAALYQVTIPAHETRTIRLRLSAEEQRRPFDGFDAVLQQRREEADSYYASLLPVQTDPDLQRIFRQAIAGLLWSKQFYHYDVRHWLAGDPAQPPPPAARRTGRNHEWDHLSNNHVLSMPDTWEYPWYASWDLAFHCVTLALVDVRFAKEQIELMVRTIYQHPNGQIPAYEWNFGDVNPPVLPWAALRLYHMERATTGTGDRAFLERVFHKFLLNFTWWVNRKDSEGNNIFQGGFLGLDNIGVFDRSKPLPAGDLLEQSDGTSWMGMFCLDMLNIALVLAAENHAYEEIATKFFEHFLYIAGAMRDIGGTGIDLWDDQDSFFYDVLRMPNQPAFPLRLRSLVGLIPLFAVTTIEPEEVAMFPLFRERLEWFLHYRADLAELISRWFEPGSGDRRQLALVRGHRLKRLLFRALDPQEFLSEFGVRSLSKYYEAHPYEVPVDGVTYRVEYQPAESRTGLFGGNSNWRGPVWFPVNYLLIRALRHFHRYYSDDFVVECPTGSGQYLTLHQVAVFLSERLVHLFTRRPDGTRPVFGDQPLLQRGVDWKDNLWFYEYFHGDTGAGLGASHQTGWTALVALLIHELAYEHAESAPHKP